MDIETATAEDSKMPEHICGWRTPSGITMTPLDCAACVEERRSRMNGLNPPLAQERSSASDPPQAPGLRVG